MDKLLRDIVNSVGFGGRVKHLLGFIFIEVLQLHVPSEPPFSLSELVPMKKGIVQVRRGHRNAHKVFEFHFPGFGTSKLDHLLGDFEFQWFVHNS